MFQSLRQANPFFILYKGENPRCEIGSVVSVSNPAPKFQNQFNAYQPNQEMVVDVKVKVGESTYTYNQLPANLAVADLNQEGVNVTVSSNRDALNSEVEAMLQRSRDIVDSVDHHRMVIASCEDMLKELNPKFAKEKAIEENITQLNDKVGGLEGTLQNIQDMLAKALTPAVVAPAAGGNSKSSKS